ncbi:MAG: carboxypeptidase-like regulatory domain-containing protein [Lacipirellulaceae bacterium]
MKRHTWWQRTCAWVAAATVVVPMQVMAKPPVVAPQVQAKTQITQPAVKTVDVALDANGRLIGEIVNVQGQPQAKAKVALIQGKKTRFVQTSARGEFRFDNVATGSYQLQVGKQLKPCRVWKQAAAPPKANQGVMLISGEQIVRGQTYCGSPVAAGYGGFKEAMTHPLVVAGVVAAAIAIPVAIHNSDDDDNSSTTP